MQWINSVDVVAMLALLQYLHFASLVGKARGKHGVRAPAVTGSEAFERIHRVQMNTLELLVCLLPGLYVAAKYWPAAYVAGIGAVYLVGRIVYWRAYVAGNPRRLGFFLSIGPVYTLVLIALVPAVLGMGAV